MKQQLHFTRVALLGFPGTVPLPLSKTRPVCFLSVLGMTKQLANHASGLSEEMEFQRCCENQFVPYASDDERLAEQSDSKDDRL